ncbi:Eukaryotic peptide chain release factor GTP-binding subunit ERF3A [Trichoplax sp. H2]|nr:Eukaryotic peptide chain release factor GTP-binding subunit ERF3A [Trichoplax sp. H2]|eukprot:RDD40768.1 Eukaryotic peptide chain release factor GTP-binding subunit ERF3A [Trichoplax sp. H2]
MSNPPDSWDSVADPGPTVNDGDQAANAFKNLNVNARPFVPNPKAKPFVPTFLKASEPMPVAAEPAVDNSTESTTVADEAIASDVKTEPNEEIVQDKAEEEPQTQEQKIECKPAEEVSKPEPEVNLGPKKEHINVIFIGHVDAGKSTIGGHLLFLTGQVDKRTLEKYEKEAKEKNRESWYLSWALDTNSEEREKGKTVEVGRATFETENKEFTILDAPGHKSFVPNMIGGAAQADIGILVISARKGEFETGFERGGQTREHAMLAKTAGVKHLIVLVNKMDDPTVQWSQQRYEECETKLIPFLKKAGFNKKSDIHFIPISGLTGANLRDPVDKQSCTWWSGDPLLSYLNELPSISRHDDGPVKFPVIDRYKDMGTIVMGKLESGKLSKGSQLILMPNKASVEILQIYRNDEEEQKAYTGQNIKLKLKGVEEEDVSPGFCLCQADSLCHVGKTFDAQIVIIEHKSIICAGYMAVLHIHACVEEVTIVALLGLVDRRTGQKQKGKPRFVKQDQIVIARLQTAGVICLETFQEFPQMGRFTLRDEGKTIAIGKVLKLKDEF